jgi:hypothetical protein
MKKTATNEHQPKTVPRGKVERIVKFGSKASPIRARIIRAVEKVAIQREAAHGK